MHYIATGLLARTHGNTNRLPKNALTFTEVKNVVKFLENYAEAHAILLPGRIPGYKRTDLQLLPSSTTKKVILAMYLHQSWYNYLFVGRVDTVPGSMR